MNKVLLTGATGFIGRHCVTFLADAGFEVHGVCHRAQPAALPAVRWHRADLLDPNDVEKLCGEVGATHLLHLAWYAEPGQYRTGKQNLDWVIGSLNLLKGFAGNGGRRAVFAGTCFEYDSAYGYCSERLTPTVPDTFYGECKHGLSNIVAGYARQFGLSTAWGRIFFLYGPFEPAAKLVASVIRNLLLNRPASCSRGLALRDYLHVEDVAGALVALLGSEVCGPVNIGSGQPVALRDIILTIAKYAGNGANLEFGAVRAPENEPPLLVADVRRLEREVQWRPEYSLQTGIEQAVNWWRTELSTTVEQQEATELKEQA